MVYRACNSEAPKTPSKSLSNISCKETSCSQKTFLLDRSTNVPFL